MAIGESTEETLRAWAELELRPWLEGPLDRVSLAQRLREMAEADDRICLFRMADGEIALDADIVRQRPWFADTAHEAGARVAAYRSLFQQAAKQFGVTGSAPFALYIADGFPEEEVRGPLLCFQKPAGAAGVLVPDIDLISHDYCLDAHGLFDDRVAFEDKIPEAIFVGSTTGRRLATTQDITDGTNERVAAAIYFQKQKGVTFDLPKIVQCNAKVRAAVEALGVTGRFRTWHEQQPYRYMLSLDGNGATCSRVAAALHGHQVLAKYVSPNILYYFHGLQAWRHFVPIVEHGDVLALVADADAAFDQHRRIAQDSRHFAQRFLTRLPILRYVALLMASYIARFGEGGKAIDPDPKLIDWALDVTGRPPFWGGTGGVDGFDDTPIERITAFPYGLAPDDIAVRGVYPDGEITSAANGGEMLGKTGKPLAGLHLTLSGDAKRQFRVRVQERFADGSVRPGTTERLQPGPAPLTGFTVSLQPTLGAGPWHRRWFSPSDADRTLG